MKGYSAANQELISLVNLPTLLVCVIDSKIVVIGVTAKTVITPGTPVKNA